MFSSVLFKALVKFCSIRSLLKYVNIINRLGTHFPNLSKSHDQEIYNIDLFLFLTSIHPAIASTRIQVIMSIFLNCLSLSLSPPRFSSLPLHIYISIYLFLSQKTKVPYVASQSCQRNCNTKLTTSRC